MADSCEWSFHLFGRHHCKSGIFERMESFQNDCCRSWIKKSFKNSYSRQLRILNAVQWFDRQQVRSIDRNLFFSKLKLLILRQWWQLWMKSTEIKQRYRINFFGNASLVCFTAEVDAWITINVHVILLSKLYGYIPVCKRTIASLFYVLIRYFLLFSSEIILKQLFASSSVNIVE